MTSVGLDVTNAIPGHYPKPRLWSPLLIALFPDVCNDVGRFDDNAIGVEEIHLDPSEDRMVKYSLSIAGRLEAEVSRRD